MTYTCTYTDIHSPEEAAEMILKHADALYNKTSGIILIADLVDGDNRENEEFGFSIDNGDWMYGIMATVITPDTAKALVAEGESLEIYAIDTVPAAGTGVPNRMVEYGTDCAEELKELLGDIFAEEPPEWTAERIVTVFRQ